MFTIKINFLFQNTICQCNFFNIDGLDGLRYFNVRRNWPLALLELSYRVLVWFDMFCSDLDSYVCTFACVCVCVCVCVCCLILIFHYGSSSGNSLSSV